MFGLFRKKKTTKEFLKTVDELYHATEDLFPNGDMPQVLYEDYLRMVLETDRDPFAIMTEVAEKHGFHFNGEDGFVKGWKSGKRA